MVKKITEYCPKINPTSAYFLKSTPYEKYLLSNYYILGSVLSLANTTCYG